MKTFSFVVFATLPFWPVAASAQLNVLISGGFSGAYERLLPEFERTSGIKVATGFAGSRAANDCRAARPRRIAAPDRTEADLQTDKRRDPLKLLTFTGARAGMKVWPATARQSARPSIVSKRARCGAKSKRLASNSSPKEIFGATPRIRGTSRSNRRAQERWANSCSNSRSDTHPRKVG